MNITPIKKFYVTIIPSWLNALVVSSPDLSYEDLLSYETLRAEKGRILTDEEIFIYVITQNYLNAFTHKAFTDQKSISSSEDNIVFIAQHADALAKANEKAKVISAVLTTGKENKEAIASTTLLAKEYYQPLLLGTDNLLLIGCQSPVFSDKRAYHNAVMEEVTKVLTFEEFKGFELFKHYLREAVV